MERALSIPETLVALLTFLRNADDIVNAACVCRKWRDCAVDTIWTTNDVPIKVVLGLLGPYTEIYDEADVEAVPAELPDEEEDTDAEIAAAVASAHPVTATAATPATAEDDEEDEEEDSEDSDDDDDDHDHESVDLRPRCLQLDVTFESMSASTISHFLHRSQQLTRLNLQRYSLHDHTIDTLRRAGPIFPHLQHIRMYPTHGLFSNSMLAVLSPTVSSLGVTTEADNVLGDVLTAAFTKSARIIEISTTSPVFITPSHLSHLTNLKYLLWWGKTPFSYKAWRALAASCSNLRSLQMHFCLKGIDALQDSESEEEIVFPSVETLHLQDRSHTGCLPGAVLASRFPSLKYISIEQSELPDADVHRIIDHVKQGSPHLAEVWAYFLEETISLQTLNSVSWSSMTTLKVDSRTGWEINDEDLEQVVRELPQLEFFDLSTNQVCPPEVEFKSDLTVLSLVSLARHCKKLLHLFLTVKFCYFDRQDDTPILAALEALSLVMHVDRLHDDLGPTAAFLATMCPNVEDPDVDVYIPGGVRSVKFIKMFRAERELI